MFTMRFWMFLVVVWMFCSQFTEEQQVVPVGTQLSDGNGSHALLTPARGDAPRPPEDKRLTPSSEHVTRACKCQGKKSRNLNPGCLCKKGTKRSKMRCSGVRGTMGKNCSKKSKGNPPISTPV